MIVYDKKVYIKYKKSNEINENIIKLAHRLNNEYKNKEVFFIGILNGSVVFMMDLIKYINFPFNYDFMKLSSYKGTIRNDIKLKLNINEVDIVNKHIVLVEDIIDSGNTIKYLINHFNKFNISSISVVSLLVRTNSKANVDHFVFEVKNNNYVIGYGMDCNNLFRSLKDIYIENDKEQTKK